MQASLLSGNNESFHLFDNVKHWHWSVLSRLLHHHLD